MKKKVKNSFYYMIAGFAFLNVIMYFTIKKFWIGGSSFLPMIGQFGESNKFIFAFIVNIGVIIGALLGAVIHKEFILRLPNKKQITRSIIGGIMIGIGITIAPGTCTTSFVTGIPMLSVASFLSASGIFIGAFIMFNSLKI